MTVPDDAVLAMLVPLAFQVWDAVGWAGQALFTVRVLVQWLASEKAKRSVVPIAYWWLSLAGSLALFVYQLHRKDPVFLAGVAVNTAIYARNLHMLYRSPDRTPRKASPVLPVVLGLLVVAALAIVMGQAGARIVRFDSPVAWLVLGFAGQTLWSGRFLLQWYISERLGRSVLPAAFFRVSIVGAVMLLAYAIHRDDYVMIAAFALNPIPSARNLILLRREQAS